MTEHRPLYELFAATEAATQAMRREQQQAQRLQAEAKVAHLERELARAKAERDAILKQMEVGR